PICNEKDEKCMSVNRRVEVLLLEEDNEKWAQNTLLESPQVNFIKSSENNIVQGEQGTKLAFPSKSFVNSSGKIVENVRVELREFYSVKDCIKSGMTMETSDGLLESGGMIELRAYDSTGTELQISPQNESLVSFKNKAENEEGMQLFYGNVENGKMLWQTTPKRDFNSTPLNGFFCADCGYFEAKQGDIIVFNDSKLGWVSVLVTPENSRAIKRIRDTPDEKRTSAQRKEIEDLILQTEKIGRDNKRKQDEEAKKWKLEYEKKLAAMTPEERKAKEEERKAKEDVVKTQMKINEEYQKQVLELQKKNKQFQSDTEKMNRSFRLRGSGFINCDRFIQSTAKRTITVDIDVDYNVQVYLFFPEINSIMSSNNAFNVETKKHIFYNVPLNYKLELFVQGKKGEQSYFISHEVNATEAMPIVIKPLPVSEEELDRLLDLKPKTV
ncbi:MAG: hypothetical protein RL204_1843, partial [Bacteroidota bacterium]